MAAGAGSLLGDGANGGLGSAAAGAGCQKPIGVSVADQKSLFYVAAVQGMQAAADKAGCQRRSIPA